MTCDPCHISRAPRLPDAGNSAAVTAERQLFYQVRGRIAWRRELCLHLALGIDRRDPRIAPAAG
jgi:hypothetical protein